MEIHNLEIHCLAKIKCQHLNKIMEPNKIFKQRILILLTILIFMLAAS
jgi:hypothetical protein